MVGVAWLSATTFITAVGASTIVFLNASDCLRLGD